MIRHVALFEWSEGVSGDDLAAVARGLETMPDHVPGILSYLHGDDLELSAATVDYALVADFATVEDYQAYATHPHHVKFIEKHVRPVAQRIHRVQYFAAE